jgi:hypothetical protein
MLKYIGAQLNASPLLHNLIDKAKAIIWYTENKKTKGEVPKLKAQLAELVTGMDHYLHPKDPPLTDHEIDKQDYQVDKKSLNQHISKFRKLRVEMMYLLSEVEGEKENGDEDENEDVDEDEFTNPTLTKGTKELIRTLKPDIIVINSNIVILKEVFENLMKVQARNKVDERFPVRRHSELEYQGGNSFDKKEEGKKKEWFEEAEADDFS